MVDLESTLTSPYVWMLMILLFVVAYNYTSKEVWKNLPPGPPALPFVGSLPFLGLGVDFRKPFRKMAAKYGNVFTVYMGSMRVVVLNGFDTVKEALVQNGDKFAGRPRGFYATEVTRGYGIAFTQGRLWEEQRKYVMHQLRELGVGRSNIEGLVTKEMDYFLKELDKHTGIPYQPQPLMYKAVANLMLSIFVGERMGYEDPKLVELLDANALASELAENSGITTIFPFLRYLPGDPFRLNELPKRTNAIFDMYQGMVDKHRELLGQDGEINDFMTSYLKKMKEDAACENTTFSGIQLVVMIYELIGAGLETTSNTLGFAAVYVTLHQNIQTRVQTEIDEIIDDDRMLIYDQRHKLPYTMACIMETQRLGNVMPTAVAHCTMDDVTIGGYFIPKGTTVLPNLNSIHMDHDTWPNPETFDPDRFIDNEGNLRTRKELLPFSAGKRVCLGENLAKMELFVVFVSLMKRYRFSLSPHHPAPEMEGNPRLVIAPKPYHIIIERRHQDRQ